MAKTLTITNRNIRMSPRKLRTFSNILRKQNVQTALSQLALLENKGADVLAKTLKNALNTADAKKLNKDNLIIAAFQVNEGTRLKRWLPAPRGRSYRITKPQSHVRITVSE